jgi:transcriptional regulator with XRE-family HTH domain
MKKRMDRAAFEHYRHEHNRCLGVAVCELRMDKGLTQSKVAKRAGVSVLWVQRLETNQLHINYTIRRLDRAARALDVELFDLYKRAGEMVGPPPWLETESGQNEE